MNDPGFRRKLERTDLKHMNLPEDYWLARFDQIQAKTQVKIGAFINKIDDALKRGVGLLLTGKPGVGKTGAACVITKEARARGYTCYFTSFWQLREDIRAETQFNDTESIADRCRSVSLLVLDNLRLEDATEKYFLSARTIEELLAFRRARRLSTIVTTRMTMKDLANDMKGLADSLEGTLLAVTVEGDNLREKLNAKLVEEFLTTPKTK
jgi:DNA replication protein DnaC